MKTLMIISSASGVTQGLHQPHQRACGPHAWSACLSHCATHSRLESALSHLILPDCSET